MANRIQMTHKAAELVLHDAPELKPHLAPRRRQETTAAGVPGTVRTYWLDVYPVSSETFVACVPPFSASDVAYVIAARDGIRQSIDGAICSGQPQTLETVQHKRG